MPKFKCELIKSDVITPDGRRLVGMSVPIPLNDAAKCESIVDMAVDMKKYVPASPNEKQEIKKKEMERMLKAQYKEGRISEDQLKLALRSL